MADVKLSVYGSSATPLNTGATLTNGSRAISAALDNSSDLYLFDDLQLNATWATNPTANSTVDVYLIPSIDAGSTYADGDASVEPSPNLYVGGFPVRAVTTAQVVAVRGVQLPPGLFKYLVKNSTGQTISTGWTMKRIPYRYTVT